MAKTISMSILKQIIRQWCNDVPTKAIARNTAVSKNTVKRYIELLNSLKLDCINLLAMEDHDLEALLAGGDQEDNRLKDIGDLMPYFTKELKRVGVNRFLLWNEYKLKHADGYQYSQFCYHLSNYDKTQQATMHFEHLPADKTYIDFTGKKLKWTDPETGEVIDTEVFVAILGYSQLTYVEACKSQKQSDFLQAVDNAIQYFSGVTKALVCDNLKSAVIKADRYEPTLNTALSDLANHYQTTILPARSLKPRDKSLVEGVISTVYTRVFAAMRNTISHSIEELNKLVFQHLEVHNNTKFQGRDYSRRQKFEKSEKDQLIALPLERYELKKIRWQLVAKNCHLQIREDKHYYSVPYQYIGKKVKVVTSQKHVQIYHNHQRIAFYKRRYVAYKYTTNKQHLPSHHQFVSDWNAEKFLNWAGAIDPLVKQYIKEILDSKPYPEQAYKSCVGILGFDKNQTVGRQRLIAACKRAINFDAYSYTTIKGIISNNLDLIDTENEKQLNLPLPDHDNIRGPQAYE